MSRRGGPRGEIRAENKSKRVRREGATSGWNGASCRGELAADESAAFGRGRTSGCADPGSTRQSDSRVVRSRSTMRTRRSAREGRPCELATVRVKPKKPLGNPVWLRKNTGRAPDAPVRTPIPAPRSRDFVRALPVVRVRGSCESIAMPRFGHPPVRSRSSLSGRFDSVRSPHFAGTAKPRRDVGSDPSTGARAQSQRRTTNTDSGTTPRLPGALSVERSRARGEPVHDPRGPLGAVCRGARNDVSQCSVRSPAWRPRGPRAGNERIHAAPELGASRNRESRRGA